MGAISSRATKKKRKRMSRTRRKRRPLAMSKAKSKKRLQEKSKTKRKKRWQEKSRPKKRRRSERSLVAAPALDLDVAEVRHACVLGHGALFNFSVRIPFQSGPLIEHKVVF